MMDGPKESRTSTDDQERWQRDGDEFEKTAHRVRETTPGAIPSFVFKKGAHWGNETRYQICTKISYWDGCDEKRNHDQHLGAFRVA